MSKEKQSVANLRKRFESTSDDTVDKPVENLRHQVSVIEKESSQQKTNTSQEQHDNQSLSSTQSPLSPKRPPLSPKQPPVSPKQPPLSPKRPPLPPKPKPQPKPTKQPPKEEPASQRFNAKTRLSADKEQDSEVMREGNKRQLPDEVNVNTGTSDKVELRPLFTSPLNSESEDKTESLLDIDNNNSENTEISRSSFQASKKNDNHKESIHDKNVDVSDAGTGVRSFLTSPLNSEDNKETLDDINTNNSENTEMVFEVDSKNLDVVNVKPGETDKAGVRSLFASHLHSESVDKKESLHDIDKVDNNSENTEMVIEVGNKEQLLDEVNVKPGDTDIVSQASERPLLTSSQNSESQTNKESPLHEHNTNNSENTEMNDNSNEAEIQNVSENHKESIIDKMNDKLDVPGTVLSQVTTTTEKENEDSKEPFHYKSTNGIEKDTQFELQSQNHDQFPQQDESKIQSRTIMFTNEGGLKDDTYVKETKHEEIVNLDTQILSAAEMITDAFGMTANDSSTDEHSDIETESSSTSSSRNGNSDASISDSGLSDDDAQSDEDSEGSGTVVERDRTEVVERDRIEVVERDRIEMVERDRIEVVERDRTEYMVEVYMQYIKHQISVTDIIKHIDFIGPRERDIILSKHKWCASDAFELLIGEIKKSAAKGKWQTFLQALELKGLKYIKLLLEEKTETHHDGNREVLKRITPELVKRLHLKTFLDKIYENELLTEDVKEWVEAHNRQYGENAAIEVALDNVGKQNENWNIILIKIFEELGLGDIADLFKFMKPKRQNLQIPGATSLPTKGRNTKKREREWRLENLSTTKTQHSVSVENDDSMQFAEIQFPPIDQSLPTRQDFIKLTSEIRKLRKTAERQILRGQAENY